MRNFILITICCILTLSTRAAEKSWQEGVLCKEGDERLRTCSAIDDKQLVTKWAPNLLNSRSWPVLVSARDSSRQSVTAAADGTRSTRFVVLKRLLGPAEANVQFAQAFCISLGGRLAYWNQPQEYQQLVSLVRHLASELRTDVYTFVGAVQLPGMKSANQGWVWLRKPVQVSRDFPWAQGEPNDHNQDKVQDHREDCAVLATYHKNALSIVDDFPCNYANPAGKFLFNGYNPKLSVACRV